MNDLVPVNALDRALTALLDEQDAEYVAQLVKQAAAFYTAVDHKLPE